MLKIIHCLTISKYFLQATIFVLLLGLISNSVLFAANKIKLIALFKDKAMVKINGKQVLLHKNKKNRYKVLLLSADSEQAVIQANGQQQVYKLNMLISTSYTKRGHAELVLWANNQNMYTHNGKINGKNVHFLVDTGATAIAMNEGHARSLGVNYKNAPKSIAQTASGIVNTWQVTLRKVELGQIKLHNVQAIVIQGTRSKQILLGMTFLSHLKITHSGKKMHLFKKY
ncbi:MAG: TIGR02281 family clan AA aspartic protease [Pseudomonadota bacterium]